MLPAVNRLTASADFSAVVRDGVRIRRGVLVVHQLTAFAGPGQPRVGLVVGRAVGGSVVRHRVARRLRAQLAARLERLAPESALVVRALPGACDVPSAQLGRELDSAFERLALRGAAVGRS